MVRIIAITLMAVAATASRMINLEKECWRLKAILRAMKEERFKMHNFRFKNRLPGEDGKVF
jgi:hypothetical protein